MELSEKQYEFLKYALNTSEKKGTGQESNNIKPIRNLSRRQLEELLRKLDELV